MGLLRGRVPCRRDYLPLQIDFVPWATRAIRRTELTEHFGEGELLRGLVTAVGGDPDLEGVDLLFFFFLCFFLEERLDAEELVEWESESV